MKATKEFFELIADRDPEVQALAQATADLVSSIASDAWIGVETSWGGYLLFKAGSAEGNTVCFLSAHKKHVSLGFAEGSELKDPSGLLQGSGKRQRHVKIKKPVDLERPELRQLICQAWERLPDAGVLEDAIQKLREICLALQRNPLPWSPYLQGGQEELRCLRHLLTLGGFQGRCSTTRRA